MILRGVKTPEPLGEGELQHVKELCLDGKSADAILYLRERGFKTPTKAMIKTPEQIEGCREAGRINSLILDAVEREIKVGMTTADIDEVVMEETKRLGGIPACLGYEGFPKAVCTSVNNVVCHGIPSKKQIIREGDIINVDCTTKFEGYFGDASRMYTFGKISPEAERLVNLTKAATMAAVVAVTAAARMTATEAAVAKLKTKGARVITRALFLIKINFIFIDKSLKDCIIFPNKKQD